MAKWWQNIKKVKYSKNNKRFLTSFDMAEAKREEARVNSLIKRGELERGNFRNMYVCTCGASGCIGCTESTITKEQWDAYYKEKGYQ